MVEYIKTSNRNVGENLIIVEKLNVELQRPLRVAHIGNIANNAYLAAKSQRELGLDAHCFSPDYTHVMGFPEWEECSFKRRLDLGAFDDFFPEIDFKRPKWFHSGSWEAIRKHFEQSSELPAPLDQIPLLKRASSLALFRLWKLFRPIGRKIIPYRHRAMVVNSLLIKLRKPGMAPALAVLKHFDIIHFYGPYNYMTQLINFNTPFLSTEHGTLRDYVFTEYEQSRYSRKGYLRSEKVLITNQDSLPAALRAGIDESKIEFTPHPSNENDLLNLRKRRSHMDLNNARIVVPARQVIRSDIDAGKGNYEIFSAIAICKKLDLKVKFQIPLWGDNVSDSVNYVRKLDIEDFIEWLPLLSRPMLKLYITEAVAVIDQLNVPAYGAIGADALAIGTPLLTHCGFENDLLAFGEIAPVMHSSMSTDIVRHLESILLSKFDFQAHALKSQLWYDKHLANDISTNVALNSYLSILDSRR